MKELIDYLKDTIGIEITVQENQLISKNKLPFHLIKGYEILPVCLQGKDVVFVKPIHSEYPTPDQLTKQLEQIEKALERQGIFIFSKIDTYARKRMVQNKTAFIIENGQITKLSKDKSGILNRELLTKNWIDWIDYWSVDFDYEDKKEIIQLEEDGEVKEAWTGNYIFENIWQSFRTKKNSKIEFVSAPHTFEKAGKYKIMVKIVDIVGVDTSHVVEVEVK